jgi:ribonuclease HII
VPDATRLRFEREAWEAGLRRVVGLDEAGRGPLAGPVVAAAVALRPGQPVDGAADSKTLAPSRRRELAEAIRAEALAWALGAASTREVEELNPRHAAAVAMRRALDRLSCVPQRLLVDGREMPGLGEHRALVGGDDRSQSIACASILAKVVRDRLMHRLHPRYPEYGWRTNHGYGTPEHLRALQRHGPTPHHRRTFAPVAQARLEL